MAYRGPSDIEPLKPVSERDSQYEPAEAGGAVTSEEWSSLLLSTITFLSAVVLLIVGSVSAVNTVNNVNTVNTVLVLAPPPSPPPAAIGTGAANATCFPQTVCGLVGECAKGYEAGGVGTALLAVGHVERACSLL
jgi:hypothetical protein